VTTPTRIDDCDPVAVATLLQAASESMLDAPGRRGCVAAIAGKGRLLATGDLHDNPMHFAKVVEYSRVREDPDAHLVLHELIHGERLVKGVDLSYRMLVKVAELLVDHPGRVHAILANHELAQMAGHSVSKGGGCMTERFNDGLDWVFGEAAPMVADAVSTFVEAMPIAARTDHGVFCSHSLPGPTMMERFDLGLIERSLELADYQSVHGSAWMMVWGRGQTAEQMEMIAERWNVSLFCLGHAFVERGIAIGGPRTLLLNSDHEHGAVLPIDLGDAPPTTESAMFSAIPLAALEAKT
jgi:hypothetical protein